MREEIHSTGFCFWNCDEMEEDIGRVKAEDAIYSGRSLGDVGAIIEASICSKLQHKN